MQKILDFLQSRGFWTFVGAVMPPILQLLDVTPEQSTAILTIVGALAGYFGVTIVRGVRGQPTSYAKKGG